MLQPVEARISCQAFGPGLGGGSVPAAIGIETQLAAGGQAGQELLQHGPLFGVSPGGHLPFHGERRDPLARGPFLQQGVQGRQGRCSCWQQFGGGGRRQPASLGRAAEALEFGQGQAEGKGEGSWQLG